MSEYKYSCVTKNKGATERFRSLVEHGDVAHSYLIESHNMEYALDFALYATSLLLCESDGAEKPCGACSACKKIAEREHPDVVLFSSSGGRFSFHIADIRELRSDAYITPNEGERKIYILENAQDMTAQAQNALLKILEEPPEDVCFFLLAQRRELLLPTVISRCQTMSLGQDDCEATISEGAYQALEKLLSPQCRRFDFFVYFLTLRPKRDAALELVSSLRTLVGKLLSQKMTGESKLQDIEKLCSLATARAFSAMSDALEDAQTKLESNANINATFTCLAYDLWLAKSA